MLQSEYFQDDIDFVLSKTARKYLQEGIQIQDWSCTYKYIHVIGQHYRKNRCSRIAHMAIVLQGTGSSERQGKEENVCVKQQLKCGERFHRLNNRAG